MLLTPPPARAPWPEPDPDQTRVVRHRGPALLVRGAAGTGKTMTALRVVADRVGSGELEPEEVLLLAPTRRAAARLRDELATRLDRTTGAPMVRTASSAAFSVLRARAALLGEPPPTLISGPEQDLVLADLLAGHALGEGAAVRWPGTVRGEAATLRGFRGELRDLLMRAAERGLGPADLRRLGREHGRPEWEAAAVVYAEYLDVTRLRTGTPDAGARFDPAVIVDEAAEALHAWESEVPDAPRPRWRLVVVDDHQESTAATARLLHSLVAGGADVVLCADPDAAVQTFRGAAPGLVDRAVLPAGELGAFGAQEIVLRRVWRHGPALRGVVHRVTEQIRGPGRAGRAAGAAGGPGTVEVTVLRSSAQEAAHVAHLLRRAHLHDGVPWERMAVVVRSGAQVVGLRRALVEAQVPVAVAGSDVPLRSEPAVRPLLVALGCVLDPDAVGAEELANLLTSPLGGVDAVGLRRLRRALRAEELAAGGSRPSDELLAEALADPARAAVLPSAVRRGPVRVARLLAAGRAALEQPAATALDVLWALWSAADVATAWQRAALAGGAGGARADRDLDAVLALFTAAEQFADRLPQAPVAAFVEHLRSQDLPADSLAAHGDAGRSVELLTAAGAAGGEWDLVVVAGVQEGVWPDLRLRDQLLGAQHLVEILAGRAGPGDRGPEGYVQARAAVLDDELRSFAVAVSRARARLVVTAVRDDDVRPSPLLDLVEPGPEATAERPPVGAPVALDLRGVVARCRAWLEADGGGMDHPAARLLGRLAHEGVPGADPRQWYGLGAPSSTEPLWPPDVPVTLSPSKLEAAWTCALRWALESAGGTAADSAEQSLGTLVHEVAAALPDSDEDQLAARLEARWGELDLPGGWVGAVQRRRAASMVHHLARYFRDSAEVIAVEQPFRVELGRVVLRGVVDRLERVVSDDGTVRVRVVDLKTGRTPASKEQARRHAQLGAYQLALEAGAFDDVTGGAPSGGAGLVYVGTKNASPSRREQPALAEDAEPEWAATLVREVADVVSRSVASASANELCRACPVTRCCPLQPEGRVVGG